MGPIQFKAVNVVLGKGQPQVQDLPAHHEKDGKVTSVWKLTDVEREQIADGAMVCMCQSTFNNGFQPVNLWVDGKVKEVE